MTWAKIDDLLPEHPKMERACEAVGDAALAAYVSAVCYCRRANHTGFVPRGRLRGLTRHEKPARVAEALVAEGLWEEVEGGWQIHDYHEYNASPQQVAMRRAAAAERQALSRAASRAGHGVTDDEQDDSVTSMSQRDDAVTLAGAGSAGLRYRSKEALEDEQEDDARDPIVAAQVARKALSVQSVFDAWKQATSRHGAKLDDKRRRIIVAAIKRNGIDDCLLAVVGWRHFAHNRGETNGTAYNDLELLLRDTAHVERFAEAERNGGQTNGAAPTDDLEIYNHGLESR